MNKSGAKLDRYTEARRLVKTYSEDEIKAQAGILEEHYFHFCIEEALVQVQKIKKASEIKAAIFYKWWVSQHIKALAKMGVDLRKRF